MSELKIDNITVEIGNKRIVFNKSAYSYQNWLDKNITVSERVTLPKTTLLDTIFYRPKHTDIQGDKFNIFHSFHYLENGKIVYSGICQLLAVNEKQEYEIQLIDSTVELSKNLKNLLNKLDVDTFDFTFNSTAYNTLKTLTSSIWIWSADSRYEKKTLANNILNGNLAYSRPFFSIKRLLELMFSVNGWSYSLSENASLIDSLIISAKSNFSFTSYEKTFDTTLIAGYLDFSGYSFLKTDTVTAFTTLNLNYDSAIRLRGYIDAENDCTIEIQANSSAATDSETQTFVVNKGRNYYDLTSNVFSTTDPTYDIQIELKGSGNVIFEDFLIYTLIDENAFGTMSAANFIDFRVKTYDNLPEIQQRDLFMHSLVNVGGFFSSDSFRKKITINSLNELSNLSALAWSAKFVEDSDRVSLLNDYAKTNYYQYSNSDFKPENLGQSFFEINNQTYPDIITKYKSIFEASAEVNISVDMIDNSIYGDNSGNIERINEIGTLLAYYEEVSTYTVARFDLLNANNIFSEYYTNFIAAIQKGIVMECRINLNKSDFFLFDFNQLIYIEQKKSNFYCLRITEYIEGRASKCLLLKT